MLVCVHATCSGQQKNVWVKPHDFRWEHPPACLVWADGGRIWKYVAETSYSKTIVPVTKGKNLLWIERLKNKTCNLKPMAQYGDSLRN